MVVGTQRRGCEPTPDPSRAERELGWKATRTIDDMCADQWRWQSQNPLGYPGSM